MFNMSSHKIQLRHLVTTFTCVLFQSTFQSKTLATICAEKLHTANVLTKMLFQGALHILVTMWANVLFSCPAGITLLVGFQIFTASEFHFAQELTVKQ